MEGALLELGERWGRERKATFFGKESCVEGRKAGPRRRREECVDKAFPEDFASSAAKRSLTPSTGRTYDHQLLVPTSEC